jgi:RNA recognition motif-containing protein
VELEGHTLFVKNVSFETTDESLSKVIVDIDRLMT